MGIFDHFTSIDDLLVELLERIGGVTEEDTHFFSYPNDGTRATITVGTTKLDFMAGTVMTPAGEVGNLGNSLRARGREYCRSLSLQADRDIIIQIGTKSKIPVFAGTWFKVAHLRFTDVKIIAAETTRIFVIACTNPDSIEMAGETYVKDPADVWDKTATIGNAEVAVRTHAPPLTFERRGDLVRWVDFESGTPNYLSDAIGTPTHHRSTDITLNGNFSYKISAVLNESATIYISTNDFHIGRNGGSCVFASDDGDNMVDIRLCYYDGAQCTSAALRYNTNTSNVCHLNQYGAFSVIDVAPYHEKKYNFSTLKIVADFATGKYVRGLCFGEEYDLGAKSLYVSASATTKRLVASTWVHGLSVVEKTVYIDNMNLTENEPI